MLNAPNLKTSLSSQINVLSTNDDVNVNHSRYNRNWEVSQKLNQPENRIDVGLV